MVVSAAGIMITDSAILKAVQSNSQCHQAEGVSHVRNYSVNLPYASKPTLHTNMSTLKVSRKPSTLSSRPPQPLTVLSKPASMNGQAAGQLKPSKEEGIQG